LWDPENWNHEICVLGLFAPVPGGPQVKKPTAPPPIDPPVTNCNTTKPDAPIDASLLTSGLPCTVTAIAPFDLDNLQHAFDFNSWLSFLALNSPASGGTIGPDAPTVWENWAEVEDVFLPNGQPPRPWGSPPIRPAICPKGSTMPILRMVGKTPNVLSPVIQPFNTGPLIDQGGQYVHYEIVMNKPMFEYIVQNHLYSQAGQNKFAGPTEFPQGSIVQNTTNGTIGNTYVQKSRDQRNGRIHGVVTNTSSAHGNIRPIAVGARLVTSNIPMLSLASTAS